MLRKITLPCDLEVMAIPLCDGAERMARLRFRIFRHRHRRDELHPSPDVVRTGDNGGGLHIRIVPCDHIAVYLGAVPYLTFPFTSISQKKIKIFNT